MKTVLGKKNIFYDETSINKKFTGPVVNIREFVSVMTVLHTPRQL